MSTIIEETIDLEVSLIGDNSFTTTPVSYQELKGDKGDQGIPGVTDLATTSEAGLMSPVDKTKLDTVGKIIEPSGLDVDAKFNKDVIILGNLTAEFNGRKIRDILGDCHARTVDWHLGGGAGSTNYPTTDYWYVNTIFYANLNRVKQIAYGYAGVTANDMYTNSCYNGVWTGWVKH